MITMMSAGRRSHPKQITLMQEHLNWDISLTKRLWKSTVALGNEVECGVCTRTYRFVYILCFFIVSGVCNADAAGKEDNIPHFGLQIADDGTCQYC